MKKNMKKKWTLKGKFMLFKMFRRTHTLRYKKGKTLLVILFDDRAIYSYINPAPIFKEIDGKVCELESERVMIYDKRMASTLKTDTEQD